MQTGKAGLQRKSKPTIAIYVDVVRAREYGLEFLHCANDVIMCTGDKKGVISPYFFERIQNIQTGALLEFVRPPAPSREDMLRPVVEEELVLPPPWGTTGLEPETASQKETVSVIQSKRQLKNDESLLEARLRAVYDQDVTSGIEKDLISIAREWNKLGSACRGDNAETVHTIWKSMKWEDGRKTGRDSSDSFQDRLHDLYSQGTANKETDFMGLAKEWNKTDSENEVRDLINTYVISDDENRVTKCVSRGEIGAEFVATRKDMYGQPSVLMKEYKNTRQEFWKRVEPTLGVTTEIIEGNQVPKEKTVSATIEGAVTTISEVSTLQDTPDPGMERAYDELTEDWNLQKMFSYMDSEEEEVSGGDEEGRPSEDEEHERVTRLEEEQAQEVEVQKEPGTSQSMNIHDEGCRHTKWEAINDLIQDNYLSANQRVTSRECLIEPDSKVAEGLANNNDNGLKVIMEQGDIVDREAEVIVNPTSSELCQGAEQQELFR